MNDTIFALATAPGRAALAVVRCSGPQAGALLKAIAGPLPKPREASLRRLRVAPDGEMFDQGLVLWFPGPASYTGENTFELHLHGGAAIAQAATDALSGLGARLAGPGEFSRRAFEAGKLSLVQAEAVADLVDAETSSQRRQALDQLGGALDQTHAAWRGKLIEISSLLEAQVDFPDEDFPETITGASVLIRGLIDDISHRERSRRGEQVREGFRVALMGAPNAGKSSLLNALLGRDAAIVTAVPGTTRDVIEAPLILAGYKVLLADTAGLRSTNDVIEAEGVRRALAWSDNADLRLWVLDGSDAGEAGFEPWEVRTGDLIVISKSDLPRKRDLDAAACRSDVDLLPTSVSCAGGLDALRARLEALVVERLTGADFPAVTRERHRLQLNVTIAALGDALGSVQLAPELAVEDVRRALRALRAIVGEVGVEDVLGGVFESFCVGK